MHLAIVTFDLTHSEVSFHELRDWLVDKALDDFAQHPGLVLKAWFSDELHREWGAVYIVTDPKALRADKLPRLPNGHTGPIGAFPTSIRSFELEGVAAGPEGFAAMLGTGLAHVHAARRKAPRWRLEDVPATADASGLPARSVTTPNATTVVPAAGG